MSQNSLKILAGFSNDNLSLKFSTAASIIYLLSAHYTMYVATTDHDALMPMKFYLPLILGFLMPVQCRI